MMSGKRNSNQSYKKHTPPVVEDLVPGGQPFEPGTEQDQRLNQQRDVKRRVGQFTGRGEAPLMKK